MFGKTSLFILASALGGLVGHLFKETGWAVTIEAGAYSFRITPKADIVDAF